MGRTKLRSIFLQNRQQVAKVTEKIYFSVTDFLRMRFSVFKTNKSFELRKFRIILSKAFYLA